MKGKLIIIFVCAFLLLGTLGVMIFLGSPIINTTTGNQGVSGESNKAIVYDKVYNESDRSAIIVRNSTGDNMAKIKLLTELNEGVLRGPNRTVFVMEVTPYENPATINKFLTGMELYNVNPDGSLGKSTNRVIHLQWREEVGQVKVDDYTESNCRQESYYGGGTYEVCDQVISGSHFEKVYEWHDFSSDDFTALPNDVVHVRGLADVYAGDNIEWIPTFFETVTDAGVKIEEWATWTDNFNNGIFAYYNMNTTEDLVQGIHNLTVLEGSPSFTSGGIIGNLGDVDTDNMWEIADNDVFDFTSATTLNFWMKSDSLATEVFLFKKDSAANGYNVYYPAHTDDKVKFVWNAFGSAIASTSTINSTVDWFMISITRNSTAICIWFNSNLEACSTSIGTMSASTHNIELSRDDAAGFNGKLDEIGWWNRSLNSTEISDLWNDGNAITYTPSAPPPAAADNLTVISNITWWGLDSNRDIIGGKEVFNTENLTVIEFLNLSFTVEDLDGVPGDIKLFYTANGSAACTTGNRQENPCFANDSFIEFANGTTTSTFEDKGAVGDFISCNWEGNLTFRNYSCQIDEHYNPNVIKHYDADYNWSDIKWQSGTDQRLNNGNVLKVEVHQANLPLTADQYKLDFRVQAISSPANPLIAYACNSSYTTGDPELNDNCALVASKTATEITDAGDKFRAIFTSALVDELVDIKYFLLFSDTPQVNKYYQLRTIKATNATYDEQWQYSTDSATTWNDLNDTYETDLNVNWFYNAAEPTALLVKIESNDTNLTLNNLTWNINATFDYPPIVSLTNPEAGSTLQDLIDINYTVVDPNDDNFQVNITLQNSTNNLTIVDLLDDGQSNYLWNTTNYSDGVYNLTVYAFENDTGHEHISFDSHEVTLDNFAEASNMTITLISPTNNSGSPGDNYTFIYNITPTTEDDVYGDQLITHYWKFDEGVTGHNATDEVNDVNLSNINGMTYITGKLGNAINIPASGRLELFGGDRFSFGTNDFTMAFWINTTDANGTIFMIGDGFYDTGSLDIQLSDGYLEIWGSGINGVPSNITINDGLYHHVVIRRDYNTNFDVWVDNGLVLNNTNTTLKNETFTPAAPWTWRLGQQWNGANQFTGQLDNLIFSQANLWTLQNISDNYNSGTGEVLDEIGPARTLLNETFTLSYSNGTVIQTNSSTLSGNTTTNINITVWNLAFGGYEWKVHACENSSIGNVACEDSVTNVFTRQAFGEVSANYTTPVFDTDYEFYELNITVAANVTSAVGTLVYNGTSYPSTVSQINTTDYSFANRLDVPIVDTDATANFYWFVETVTDQGILTDNSTTYSQSVTATNLTTCDAPGFTEYVNFTVYDENTTGLLSPTSLDMDVISSWYLGSGTVTKNSSFSHSGSNSQSYCASHNETFITSFDINLEKPAYDARTYNINKLNLTNTITPRALYMIPESQGSNIIIEVKDLGLVGLTDLFVKIYRYYPSNGQHLLVEERSTDSFGQFVAKLVEDDVTYKFEFYDSDNNLDKTSNNVIIACRSAFCSVRFVIDETEESVMFNDIEGYTSNITYDNDTNQIIASWGDTSGDLVTHRLEVSRVSGGDIVTACNATNTNSVGTIVCQLTSTDESYISNLYRYESSTGEIVTAYSSLKQKSLAEVFGLDGLIWSFVLLMTLIVAGMWLPWIGIALYVIGVIALGLMGILYISPAILVAQIVIGVLFIWAFRG